MHLVAEVVALALASVYYRAEAAHCYNIVGKSTCESNAQGAECAYCNGRCQMATDLCVTIVPQDQLPGTPFFKDFSHLLSTNPTQKNYGISVTDINADGTFEFVVAGFGAANQAFRWDASAGSFKDVALGNPALQDQGGMAIGLAACDVDADGFEELYILNTDSYSGNTQTSDKLIDRDDASGTYSDILAGANYVAGRSCACIDRFGNGRYGVFVANYGGPMRLYEMPDGETGIRDVAAEVGVAKTTGGRALIAGPLVTNRMDVFANNEGYGSGGRLLRGSTMNASSRRLSHRLNFFFANDGAGGFQDIAAEIGLLDDSQTGRGTAILDSNGDGLLDIVYGNWNGPHRLFVQEKDTNNCPKFVDKAPSDMATASPIRTVISADFDNDGYEEIFWNNIPGANRLFRKLPTDNDWTQVKIGDALEENGYGTGAAVGDFDGDGQLELVVAHGESASQPLSYFRPLAGANNNWLRILPLTAQGAPARGAKVSLMAGGRMQVRVIDAGSGYLCQMEPVAHFGLGLLTSVDSVTVTWPDGASQMIATPGIKQVLRVTRSSDLVTPDFRGQCEAQSESPIVSSSESNRPSNTPSNPQSNTQNSQRSSSPSDAQGGATSEVGGATPVPAPLSTDSAPAATSSSSSAAGSAASASPPKPRLYPSILWGLLLPFVTLN